MTINLKYRDMLNRKYLGLLFLCCSYLQGLAQAPLLKKDLLSPGNGHSLIKGFIGDKMNASINNRVMEQDEDKVIKPFAVRTEKDFNDWRCEYWGKWMTSAVLASSYSPTHEHQDKLKQAVSKLLMTQSADGYIGTYKKDAELEGWDVWGRKYVLLGLISYYDLTKDKSGLEAAGKQLDYLIAETGKRNIKLTDNGLDAIDGLSSNSILEPVLLMYERTGNRKYYDFAQGMVKNWSLPGKFAKNGLKLVEHGIEKLPPINVAAPKAYEMMSCFEGICELYRVSGDEKYLKAAQGFANSILTHERMIVGSGSNQELWSNGVKQQTELMQQPMETCVTTTWMKLCYQLLRLSGDSKWADELEISLYNALAGAQTPNGNWWSYFSPLSGERVPSTPQHEDVGLSCCVANGPRGLLLTPKWAVMTGEKSVYVNLYAPAEYSEMVNGANLKLNVLSDYPVTDKITIDVNPDVPGVFTIALRIPTWSKENKFTVNDKSQSVMPGSYAKITRHWKKGDKIVFYPDLRGRILSAPSGAPQMAVMRGPVVLAIDNRMVKEQDSAVWLLPKPWDYGHTELAPAGYKGYVLDKEDSEKELKSQYIDLVPYSNKPDHVWMAFEVAFLMRPSHFFDHKEKTLVMCDYASAGNEFSADNLFRVWLPQPLFLRNAFAKDTWKITYPGKKERPVVPSN